ncbi:MAG: hypothetical protein FWH57_07190 [Oscillospiraceae bacterium]|nr:hypothetical protein [Oscillospiraceae bacterium]
MNCRLKSVNQHERQSAKRLIALAICVLFIAGSLLSAAFIFTHIHHEHDHNAPNGGCTTCVHISAAENLLKSLSAALAGAALIIECFSAIRSLLKPVSLNTGFFTLIHLKVRLNN